MRNRKLELYSVLKLRHCETSIEKKAQEKQRESTDQKENNASVRSMHSSEIPQLCWDVGIKAWVANYITTKSQK